MSAVEAQEWRDFAVFLARASAAKICQNISLRSGSHSGTASEKDGNADLVTETDEQVEKFIRSSIQSKYPTHKFVGEESAGEPGTVEANLTDDPTWVVDPIDGTMNFVHVYTGFAVSIAVLFHKRPLVGVVLDVDKGRLYTAIGGQGAWCNGVRLSVSRCDHIHHCLLATETTGRRDAASISEISQSLANLLTARVAGVRMSGSAALNVCHVAEGAADAYFEFGPHIWDIAAAEVILREAGGVSLDPVTMQPPNICSRRYLAAATEALARQIEPHIVKVTRLPTD